MTRLAPLALSVALLAVPLGAAPAPTEPARSAWPMFGGTPARNMVNLTERLVAVPRQGPNWEDAEAVKRWADEWVLWKADLGSRTYGGPTVAGGKVYVGTNNEQPRNARDLLVNRNGEVEPLDKGVLMCFDEKTGAFLWQAVHDKLPNGNTTDWPKEGLCSTPAVVGNRVYYVSNQCRVVCADANGFGDGNQGIQTEKYQDKTDADVIWEYDMIKELKVFPHNMSNCSPLVVGNRVFVCTSNGVDESHINIPSPNAPSLICLDRDTGKLLWKDASPGKNVMHGQWSSPAYIAGPAPQVLHAQGDGWLRAFDPETGKLLWQFDCNPKDAVYDLGGTGTRNDFIATPVVHDGRVYIGTGQDPEHSTGIAWFFCIDPNGRGDVSKYLETRTKGPNGEDVIGEKPNPNSREVWRFGGAEDRKWAPRDFKFGRTLSTACVVDGLVYAAELHGHLHCLDAKTGAPYWQYDTKASIWGAPYYADGKVFLATDSGDLFVFRHAPKPKQFDAVEAAKDAPDMKAARAIQKAEKIKVEKEYLFARIEFPSSMRTAAPVVANGTLFVVTENALFAIKKK